MSTAILERLRERQVETSIADAQMARAAYDAGEITWSDLKDVVSHLLLAANPEWRSSGDEPVKPRNCQCGATLRGRNRKCDDCVRSN